MTQHKLYARDGFFVAEVTIPPFDPMPEVVIWGERIFTKQLEDDAIAAAEEGHVNDICYVEAFAWFAPPQAVAV
jgi:hypothetical protein